MIKVIYIDPDNQTVETYVTRELLETVIAAFIRSGCRIMEVRE
jgi:hypothetical protein